MPEYFFKAGESSADKPGYGLNRHVLVSVYYLIISDAGCLLSESGLSRLDRNGNRINSNHDMFVFYLYSTGGFRASDPSLLFY